MKKFRKPSQVISPLDIPAQTPMRARSAGVISAHDLAMYEADGTALTFDPMQQGWVRADCDDDLTFAPAVSFDTVQLKPRTKMSVDLIPLQPQYLLRAWGTGDLETYKALLDDPEVWRFMPEDYPNPLSDDMAMALIELSNASNHHQVFAILRDGDVVGQVRLEYDVEPDNGASAEISFWIGRAHWGKGIGRDVVKLFTKRSLRDNPWLTSLIARVHEDNVKSMKALLNAGYTVEGADKKRANWVQLRLQREDTGL